jgi:uncharacterized lipoprotein YajG
MATLRLAAILAAFLLAGCTAYRANQLSASNRMNVAKINATDYVVSIDDTMFLAGMDLSDAGTRLALARKKTCVNATLLSEDHHGRTYDLTVRC